MNRFALVGYDIDYSYSPKLHKKISILFKQDFKYNLEDVKIDDISGLIMSNKYQGLNITKPYKEEAIKYVDELTFIARKIGAINTIYYEDNKVIGDNTDYYGFIDLIKYYNINLNHKKIIILGTGGAALACYYACLNYTNKICFISRQISNKIMPNKVYHYNDISNLEYDIIINATPIGTYPNIDKTPIKEEHCKGKIVIDLVYNPSVTKLMSFTDRSYNGIVMLISQALHSHKKWNIQKTNINNDSIKKIKELIEHE